MRAAKILVLALIVGQASEVNAVPWKMALQLWEGTCSLISNAMEISQVGCSQSACWEKGGEGLWKKVCPEKRLKNTPPPGINHPRRRQQTGERAEQPRGSALWFVVFVLFLGSNFWLLFKVVLPRNKVDTLLILGKHLWHLEVGGFCKYS